MLPLTPEEKLAFDSSFFPPSLSCPPPPLSCSLLDMRTRGTQSPGRPVPVTSSQAPVSPPHGRGTQRPSRLTTWLRGTSPGSHGAATVHPNLFTLRLD